jgi:stearoyl-CoA desaturase (Delta-9 desaturase)
MDRRAVGRLVRVFLTHHVIWSVNSVCHTFGARPFDTGDMSRNQWLVGLLAFGEGWHNNHHAFPRSAFHGLRWWQFDMAEDYPPEVVVEVSYPT